MNRWYSDLNDLSQSYKLISESMSQIYYIQTEAINANDYNRVDQLNIQYNYLSELLGKCLETIITVRNIIAGFERDRNVELLATYSV